MQNRNNGAVANRRSMERNIAKYYVRVNGNRILAFSRRDAEKLADRTGGQILSVPFTR